MAESPQASPHFRVVTGLAIDSAIGAQRAEALLVGGDPFLFGSSQQIIAMTARHVIPAIYDFREAAISGGLWRMARILPNNYRQLGDRVSRPRGSYWHSAHIATQPVDVDFRR
jgi:hypothetical protein